MINKLIKLTGCLIIVAGLVFIAFVAVYFSLQGKQNVLILGIDAREDEGNLGRTDTMIVTTIDALKPNIGVLSIPRDLWVNIPGYGENRINTAYFFAEAQTAGSGPEAAMDVVESNFGIDVDYYARVRFDNLIELISMVEGVDINLDSDMSGYTAGIHHLDGEQALAFVRDRAGSDDFYRMERGQLLIRALLTNLLQVKNWQHIPKFLEVINSSVDTNIPLYDYPRLGVALLRMNPNDIQYEIISREMVTPFTTEGGAAVLAPNWELIHPLVTEIFGQ